MKPQNKRKIVLVILSAFLIFAIILGILLFNKKTQEPEIGFNDTDVTNNNIAIYGNPDKEEIDEHLTPTEESPHLDAYEGETIFDKTNDSSKLSSYNLSKPTIVENSNFSGLVRKIIGSYEGYTFVHNDNNGILYYDPDKKETLLLTDNVNKAFMNVNSPYVLFEQQKSNGYSLSHFNFIENKDGFVHIVTLANSANNFGIAGEFNYFTTKEEPNKTYYLPAPKSSEESLSVGFKSINGTKNSMYGEKLISFNADNNTLYELEFGKQPKVIEEIPIIENHKFITHLKVNPFSKSELIYVATFSPVEEYPVGSKVVINGLEAPDLSNIIDIEWLNRESVLYLDDSVNGAMSIYNFRTKEKHVLDTDVISLTFNQEENTIYYLKHGSNSLYKITVN